MYLEEQPPQQETLVPAGLTNAGTYGTVQDAINASRRNENPIDRGGDGYHTFHLT